MRIIFKTIFLFILLFSIPILKIEAQSFTLGGGLNLKTPGSKSTFGVGLNLSGEYGFMEHYAARLNSSYVISTFQNTFYFGEDTYTQGSFEGELLYYPFNSSTRFYGGAGIGYYILNTNRAGNPHYISEGGYLGNYVTRNVVDNTLGYNLLGGIKFNANSPFSVSLEFKYVILNPTTTSFIIYNGTQNITVKDKINLSTLLTSLSFNFRF